jgi:hypothetical protein
MSLNRTCKDNSMDSKRTQVKKKTQEDTETISELREDFNKLQKETKKTIKRSERDVIKKTTQDMKEEFNKDMESLRKKT